MSIVKEATRIGKEAISIKSKSFKLQHQQSSTSTLRCSMWNVTSMVNKTPDIMEHLLDRDPSIVFLQETWLKTNRNNVTALVKEYDYVLLHNIRKNREKENGGGVGVLLKKDIKYKRINHSQFTSFEHIIVKINRVVPT